MFKYCLIWVRYVDSSTIVTSLRKCRSYHKPAVPSVYDRLMYCRQSDGAVCELIGSRLNYSRDVCVLLEHYLDRSALCRN